METIDIIGCKVNLYFISLFILMDLLCNTLCPF